MIEEIVMIGVIWNAVLQTAWFIWTLKNHSHKHIENNELESPFLGDYIEPELTPKSREEVLSGDKKYDPNKVKGAFDGLFGGPDV
jgi:hypothetical protein